VRRGGEPITVPVHGRTGHYNLVVEGHFIPAPGQTNRTATYGLLLSGAGGDRLLEGTFNQTWGTQRIGSGRRSSVVPVMTQTTQVLNPIDDRDGHDLTLKLTELSPGVREALGVRLYRDSVPPWLLIVLGIAALGAAIGVDTWRPKHVSEGLMATLTLAVLVSVATFRNAAAAAPGFPQLLIAALMGTLVGALGGSLLWRLVERARALSARR